MSVQGGPLIIQHEVYKGSESDWLGDIPANWRILPNRYIFELKKDQVGRSAGDYELLSLTLNGVIKRDMENPEGKFPAEFDTYQTVEAGDFVFCLFDVEETPRTVGLSKFNGMITGAYTVFSVREGFDRDFLFYFYLNLDVGKRLKPLYRGLRNTIPKESFYSFKVAVPPISEQTAIANFLDKKTAQIDEAIAIKEQQIALLKERKQIIIQQAVTRGLDPTVPMKDSGVDWIGEIPVGWEAIKLKHLFTETGERTETGKETLLSLRMELGLVPHDDVSDKPIEDSDLVGYKLTQPGQMVMNRMRAAIGIFGVPKQKGLVSPDYAVFNPIRDLNLDYFLLLFKTQLLGTQFRLGSKGLGTGSSGFMRLYSESFGNIFIPLCSTEEQQEILEFVQKVSEQTAESISLIEAQVEKLKEYKTTLINSAVTGKIKVA